MAGGVHGFHQVTSAELYNPATGTWSATGAMNVARSGQTATLLPDGQVLVAGGGCNGHGYGCDAGSFEATLSSAELYNPATGTWARTGSMKSGRQFFTATLLKNGQVLAAGGFNNCDDDFCSDVTTADLYNPATGTWTQTGSMHGAREQHSATLLPDGDVLVAGGLNEGGFCCSQFEYSSAELYNPATGTWTPTASMAVKHAGQTATLLPNGWVLVAGGGTPVAEIYEPGPGIWVSPGAMSTARTHQTATLLPDGRVLVAGGDGPDGQPLSTAEEFLAGQRPAGHHHAGLDRVRRATGRHGQRRAFLQGHQRRLGQPRGHRRDGVRQEPRRLPGAHRLCRRPGAARRHVHGGGAVRPVVHLPAHGRDRGVGQRAAQPAGRAGHRVRRRARRVDSRRADDHRPRSTSPRPCCPAARC